MAASESNLPATEISPDLDTVRETMRDRDASIDPAPADAPEGPGGDEASERHGEDDPDRGEDEPDEDE